jgi:hypothetical protein
MTLNCLGSTTSLSYQGKTIKIIILLILLLLKVANTCSDAKIMKVLKDRSIHCQILSMYSNFKN